MYYEYSRHVPVMFRETLELLQPQHGGSYIDATIGGGGHAAGLLERSGPDGRVLGIDMDAQALERVRTRLASYVHTGRLVLVHGNFADLAQIAAQFGFPQVQGVLLDLGFSSDQIEDPERGLSFNSDGPLDMRLDQSSEVTAADLVNTASEQELANIFWRYGQEPRGQHIARHIVRKREMYEITSTAQLAALVVESIPYRLGKIHPATRAFQALRIAVNQELTRLEAVLPQIVDLLAPAGRMAIITFHSLEDRIVKGFLRYESTDCICSPRSPVCVCNHKARLQLLTKKPVMPTEEEIARNPRARSAKLRVAEIVQE